MITIGYITLSLILVLYCQFLDKMFKQFLKDEQEYLNLGDVSDC